MTKASKGGPLSATALRTLPVGKHGDGGGLFLRVKPNGARLWQMKYRFGGRELLASYGPFPEVSLAEARKRRDSDREQLRRGINPNAARDQAALSRRHEAESLFPAVADRWLEFKKAGWASETYRKAKYVVHTGLVPKLRKVSLATLTTKQAKDALTSIAGKAPALADKARQYLGGIETFAKQEGLRGDELALSLRGALPKREKGHVPAATTIADLRKVLAAVDAYPSPVTRAALRLSLLTNQRPGVIAAAHWEEMDAEAAQWRIPKEKMKVRRAYDHIVPLSRQALSLLEEMRPHTGGKGYVFPAQARQKTPHLHRDSLSKALRDAGLRDIHTTHGSRASLRTLAREYLRADWDLLEAQLAHAKKGEVQQAYDRTQFIEGRAEVMQEWADFLDSIAAGGKVIPFKRKAA